MLGRNKSLPTNSQAGDPDDLCSEHEVKSKGLLKETVNRLVNWLICFIWNSLFVIVSFFHFFLFPINIFFKFTNLPFGFIRYFSLKCFSYAGFHDQVGIPCASKLGQDFLSSMFLNFGQEYTKQLLEAVDKHQEVQAHLVATYYKWLY